MSVQRASLVLLALSAGLPGPATAWPRARIGGTFRLALLPEVRADRSGDTPEGAVVRGLLAAPLCRLDAAGRPEPLLARLQRTSDGVTVALRPGAVFASGAALGAAELAQGWVEALDRSPVARALLSPVRTPSAVLEHASRSGGTSLPLPLLHPWPDLEATLCHPALTPVRAGGADGVGLYVPEGSDRARASTAFPEGRPFPDALALATLSRRAAQRALEGRTAQVLLGDGTDAAAPALFATYLVHRAAARPVVALLDGRLDRAALVRSFVGGPAAAMPGLLPPALGGPEATPRTAPGRGSGSAVLMYAQDRPGQRAVAERLQILLRDAGVQLTLAPRGADALDRDWRAGQGDLALRSVLLPPLPAPALAVVLELAGDAELARRELAALGAVPDAEARASRARERALGLASALPVVPLYVEGLRARLDPALVDVRRDGFGLLVLDDAWWP